MADSDPFRETLETRGMSDRDLMLATFHKTASIEAQLKAINGRVGDHHIEIHGDAAIQHVGLKELVVRNTAAIKTGKTVFATLAGVVSIIGIANLIAMLTLLTRITGG